MPLFYKHEDMCSTCTADIFVVFINIEILSGDCVQTANFGKCLKQAHSELQNNFWLFWVSCSVQESMKFTACLRVMSEALACTYFSSDTVPLLTWP